MKKVIQLCMVALAIFAIPFSFAQDVNSETDIEINAETQAELDAMDTVHGIQMRVAQLERAIQKQITVGEEVIVRIEASYDYDTSNLTALLDELEELATDAASIDVNASVEVVAEEYIEIKESAKVIVKEFRVQVREMLTDEDKAQIRANANARVRANVDFEALRERIEEKRQKANEARAERMANRIGLSVSAIARIKENSTEAKEAFKAEIRASQDDFRAQIRAHVEDRKTRNEVRKAAVEARIDNISARVDARVDRIADAKIRAYIAGTRGMDSNESEMDENQTQVRGNVGVRATGTDVRARGMVR